LILRPASDNAQFMGTVIVNTFPTPDLDFWSFSWIYSCTRGCQVSNETLQPACFRLNYC